VDTLEGRVPRALPWFEVRDPQSAARRGNQWRRRAPPSITARWWPRWRGEFHEPSPGLKSAIRNPLPEGVGCARKSTDHPGQIGGVLSVPEGRLGARAVAAQVLTCLETAVPIREGGVRTAPAVAVSGHGIPRVAMARLNHEHTAGDARRSWSTGLARRWPGSIRCCARHTSAMISSQGAGSAAEIGSNRATARPFRVTIKRWPCSSWSRTLFVARAHQA